MATDDLLEPVVVDGRHLRRTEVVAVARNRPPVHLHPAGRARAAEAAELGARLARTRPIYGRSTGVGANRHEIVPADDPEHGLRILRSHASGTGEREPVERVRAMMLVRLNQLAAGGSGVDPEVLDALTAALDSGAVPAVPQLGAIGTGDLTALAALALALCGDRPWPIGEAPVARMTSADALAFISSNAATIGEAVLAQADLDALLRASEVVAALSFVALGGAAEAYGSPVQNARAHPGQLLVATRMRRLLGFSPTSRAGRRLQDPFSLRAVPQVHGAAVDAVERLGTVLDVELNARAENPLIDVATGDAWHNANFHTGYLAHALDSARAAVYPVAELSAARLGDLVDPDFTGLSAFLADGPPGSSGVMALEYVAQDGVATLRHTTLPATLGSAVISRGLEDHASYSTHAARLATACVPALRTVLAAELVAAVRAIAMAGGLPPDHALTTAYEQARAALDGDTRDRPLTADLAAAGVLLDGLGTRR
ncbi:histidine ammonia-lyase [Pseudonocardia thermophila]|jgi:Histidine ammonia-lyase|uniref:Histidine ammonia-lyase n=1 Tax=Pseudonocardia thermophila TaxID=1848 RepID=A0A1M6TIG7_PSETH|nr:aromatic amino acid ammonia-lyase [Pseudonocardia thermophila]SHK56902.1 histidine ammonia-lyase [Pseudonocardia thermophila]